MVGDEGIEPVWHLSSRGYRVYKAPPRPTVSPKLGAAFGIRTQFSSL